MDIYKEKSRKALMWLLCITFASMFFSFKVSHYAVTSLIGFCALMSSTRNIVDTTKTNRMVLLIVGMYVAQMIGLLYTDNYSVGFFMLDKKIFFVIIPVLVLSIVQDIFNDDDWRIFFLRIGYITIASSLVLLLIAVYKKFVLGKENAFYYGKDLNEGFTPINYPYYSMYFAFGSLALFNVTLETMLKRKGGVWLSVLLLLYSLTIMILVASKTGIAIFAIALITLLYHRFNRKIFWIGVCALAISISILIFFNKTTQERFTGLTDNLSVVIGNDIGDRKVVIDDLNMRLLFWKISFTHSWRDKLVLTGTGTGDVQDYLDRLYQSPQYQLFGYVGWDTHNQWVYTFVQLGIIGVSLMAMLYLEAFRQARKSRDLNFLCFLIITLAFSFTESILETSKGILFFSFFLTLFAAKSSQRPTLVD